MHSKEIFRLVLLELWLKRAVTPESGFARATREAAAFIRLRRQSYGRAISPIFKHALRSIHGTRTRETT